MNSLRNNSKGFTLIELLVVIAIIAVLASLSFVGLQNARRRGNDVGALGQMNAILAQAQICADQGVNLISPAAAAEVCNATTGTDAVYPALPTGWAYVATGFDGVVSDGTYAYRADSSVGGTKTITCTEGGCVKTGF